MYKIHDYLGLVSEHMILDSTLKNAFTKVYHSTVIANDYTDRDRASLKKGRLISLL